MPPTRAARLASVIPVIRHPFAQLQAPRRRVIRSLAACARLGDVFHPNWPRRSGSTSRRPPGTSCGRSGPGCRSSRSPRRRAGLGAPSSSSRRRSRSRQVELEAVGSACRQSRAATTGKPESPTLCLPRSGVLRASWEKSSTRERRPSLRAGPGPAPSHFVCTPRTARPRPPGRPRRDSSATRRSLGVSSSREAARPPIRDGSARARSAQSGALHSSKSVRAA